MAAVRLPGMDRAVGAASAEMTVPGVRHCWFFNDAQRGHVPAHVGAISAGADEVVRRSLTEYSRGVGVAYQIRDDLEDFGSPDGTGDLGARRLSLLTALAGQGLPETAKARELLAEHRAAAETALRPVRNQGLKMLLYRVLGRILGTAEGL